jgi:NAD(P)-dependent dehydrogenase (short-subunit alcohol dehydrogenase family)
LTEEEAFDTLLIAGFLGREGGVSCRKPQLNLTGKPVLFQLPKPDSCNKAAYRSNHGITRFTPVNGYVDVSKATEVENLLDKAIITYGKLNIAFNNAGVEGDWVPITEQTEESWDHVIDINLKGVWLCLKYEILQMLKQGSGGAIVEPPGYFRP